jgi:hypothetical protein
MDNSFIKQFDDQVNKTLSNLLQRQNLIRGLVHLMLVLYAARLAPTLPQQVLLLFENAYFKLFVFSLVLWTAQFSPSTSILIALGFMVSVNYATNKPLWEFLENMESQPMEYHSSVEHMAPFVQQTDVQQPMVQQQEVQQPMESKPDASGCYPVRKVDMTNVMGMEKTEYSSLS